MRQPPRWLLLPLLFAATLMAACCAAPDTPAPVASRPQLNIASFGGSFQEALERDVVRPIAREMGVATRVEAYSGEYDRLAATIRNGTNTLDLVHVETVFLKQGEREQLTAPIDWAVVPRNRFIPGATSDRGVGMLAWSLVLAWNTQRLPRGATRPASWTDLFDTKRWPGPRCLRKTPEGNLELALLADGVAPADLYTHGLDVDRALRKLSGLKPFISWWSSGSELEQKLSSACALAAGWNGRVLNLREAGKQPVDFTYAGAIHQFDWWVVPANAAHKVEAMRFLAGFAKGEGQVAIARQFGYGPVSVAAVSTLTPALAASMPSSAANLEAGVAFNADWWNAHQARVLERWNTWLLGS